LETSDFGISNQKLEVHLAKLLLLLKPEV